MYESGVKVHSWRKLSEQQISLSAASKTKQKWNSSGASALNIHRHFHEDHVIQAQVCSSSFSAETHVKVSLD